MTGEEFIKIENKLIADYEKIKPLLTFWGDFVDYHLIELLQKKGFDINRIQIKPKHRIKTDKSLIRNAFYRNSEISSDPLKKIEDKVGTRIVVTNLKDLEEIKQIVIEDKEFWEVRISRSETKHLSNPREFDYQALHINLTPLNSVKEFINLSKSKREYYICELQIKTLLQHAFAEVAHDTVYKGPFSEESNLVRILSRSMALMEATDDYFCKAYDIMKEENTYEKNFLSRLIKLSKERFEEQLQFLPKNVDIVLTGEAFSFFEIRNIELDEVERILIQEKEIIEKALKHNSTYLKEQPVILVFFYLIISKTAFIKEKWFLDEEILKDLFFKLGYSFGK